MRNTHVRRGYRIRCPLHEGTPVLPTLVRRHRRRSNCVRLCPAARVHVAHRSSCPHICAYISYVRVTATNHRSSVSLSKDQTQLPPHDGVLYSRLALKTRPSSTPLPPAVRFRRKRHIFVEQKIKKVFQNTPIHVGTRRLSSLSAFVASIRSWIVEKRCMVRT